MFTQIMSGNNHSILCNALQCTRVPLYKEWQRFLSTQKNLYYSFLLVYTARPYFLCFFFLLANGLCVCVCAQLLQLCPTLCDPWTVACQVPLFMEFSRQEYYSGQPFPSPWDFPDTVIKPRSPALQVDSLPSETPGKWI